jgi:hypothetical protein
MSASAPAALSTITTSVRSYDMACTAARTQRQAQSAVRDRSVGIAAGEAGRRVRDGAPCVARSARWRSVR